MKYNSGLQIFMFIFCGCRSFPKEILLQTPNFHVHILRVPPIPQIKDTSRTAQPIPTERKPCTNSSIFPQLAKISTRLIPILIANRYM